MSTHFSSQRPHGVFQIVDARDFAKEIAELAGQSVVPLDIWGVRVMWCSLLYLGLCCLEEMQSKSSVGGTLHFDIFVSSRQNSRTLAAVNGDDGKPPELSSDATVLYPVKCP